MADATNTEVNEPSTRMVENVGSGLFVRLFGRKAVTGALATVFCDVVAAGEAMPDAATYPLGWRVFVVDLNYPAFRGFTVPGGATPAWVDAAGNLV